MKKSIYYILFWMFLFLCIVSAVCGLLFTPLYQAFIANQVFNSMILAVFLIGVMVNFRQVLSLLPEARWIELLRQGKTRELAKRSPRLLGPMAKMLTAEKSLVMSSLSLRSLLDGIRSRLDEARDWSRYMIGLLIFLGLLGTFWGLLATLGSIGTVIDGLSVHPEADIGAVFNDLKTGLKEPLTGMGVAFSSSLFGLAGSLILGLLDLQAGHAQNRFCNTLEDWLTEATRLSVIQVNGEGEPQWPDYIQSLLAQTADNLDKFQRQLVRSENERVDTNVNVVILAERIEHLTQQLHDGQKIMLTLAENHLLGSEQSIPDSIRALNSRVEQLSEQLTVKQNQTVEELRGEVRLLARTVSMLAPQEAVPDNSNTNTQHIAQNSNGRQQRVNGNGSIQTYWYDSFNDAADESEHASGYNGKSHSRSGSNGANGSHGVGKANGSSLI